MREGVANRTSAGKALKTLELDSCKPRSRFHVYTSTLTRWLLCPVRTPSVGASDFVLVRILCVCPVFVLCVCVCLSKCICDCCARLSSFLSPAAHVSLQHTHSATPTEGRKALPKTSSFDDVTFMQAAMNDTFMKGSDDIKACLETLILAKGEEAITAADKLSALIVAAGVRSFTECNVVETLKKMLGDRDTSEAALRAISSICDNVGGVFVCACMRASICVLCCNAFVSLGRTSILISHIPHALTQAAPSPLWYLFCPTYSLRWLIKSLRRCETPQRTRELRSSASAQYRRARTSSPSSSRASLRPTGR